VFEGQELRKWEKIKGMLDESSAELCIAVLKHCIQLTLDRARMAYRDAYVGDQKFKALLINRAGHNYKDAVSGLDERINAAMSAFSKWIIVGEWVADLARDALAHERRLDLARLQLDRVSGDWAGTAPGAATGWGIPGIDTPENIERIHAEEARKKAEEAKKKEEAAEKEAALRAKREKAAAEAVATAEKALAASASSTPTASMGSGTAPVQKKVDRGEMGSLFKG